MNDPVVKSYDDLIAEKERLKRHFHYKKEALKAGVSDLKDSLNPIKQIAKKLSMFTSKDKSLGLVNVGFSFVLDLILKKLILRKTGWVIKMIAPFLIKNAISHLAAQKIKREMPALGRFLERTPRKI